MNSAADIPGSRPDKRSPWLKALQFGTIRTRLLIAFLLLVLLPAIIISISAVILGLQNGQRQVINQLQSVATLKDEQIETWLESLRVHLSSVLYPHQVPRLLDPLLDNDPDSEAYQRAYAELRIQFEEMIEATELFEEVMLLDPRGRVLISTDVTSEGQVHAMQAYFWRGLEGPYTQSLSSSTAQGLSSPVVVSRPVFDPEAIIRGVVVGRASSERLNDIMLQRAGLGETGETYLVGTNFLLLTDSRFEDRDESMLRFQTEIIESVFLTKSDSSGRYENYRHRPVVGVYHWVPSLQMVLVAEQEQAEAFQAIYTALTVHMFIAVVAVLIALISALFTARGIATPLASLANTATRIAAGDLNLTAPIKRADEIGALARAFNSMTARLRQLISNLEMHVNELQQAEAEVRRVNDQLERDVAEQEALNRLSNALQRCTAPAEAYAASMPFLRELFGDHAGAFYRRTTAQPFLELIGHWGTPAPAQLVSPPSDCPAFQGNRFSLVAASEHTSLCSACYQTRTLPVVCVPLQAGGESFGLLHMWFEEDETESITDHVLPLMIRTADLLALALANLHLREDLHEQAIRDPLTGLFNRRFLNEALARKLSEAQRHQRALALLLLDIDHFKRINDTYGHDAGDAVLRAVGRLLSSGLRAEDTACRFGGEEMLLVLSEITREDALASAERLRKTICTLDIESGGAVLPLITVSIGVSLFPYHGTTADTLITAADHALYEAKTGGRNRVCVAKEKEPSHEEVEVQRVVE